MKSLPIAVTALLMAFAPRESVLEAQIRDPRTSDRDRSVLAPNAKPKSREKGRLRCVQRLRGLAVPGRVRERPLS